MRKMVRQLLPVIVYVFLSTLAILVTVSCHQFQSKHNNVHLRQRESQPNSNNGIAVKLVTGPNGFEANRVKRIIGPTTSTAAAGTVALSAVKDETPIQQHKQNNNNNHAESSNYYQHFENNADADDDDDDDDDKNDLLDGDNNLNLTKEIQELVEHNIIQNEKNGKKKNRHLGPPPFVNTLQSSSHEEFIVRNIADDAGSSPGDDDHEGHVNQTTHKRLVLVTSKSPEISTRRAYKRKKSNESNYVMATNENHIYGHHGHHVGGVSDKTQCICDTKECVSNQAEPTVCYTHGMCYTQFLDMQDGTPSITKGCINGETPLLCENRRPSSNLLRNKRWPYLICCKSHLCNAGEVTTTVPKVVPRDPMMRATGLSSYTTFNGTDDAGREDRYDLGDSQDGLSTSKNETHETNSQQTIKGQLNDDENSSPTSGGKRFISPLASSFLIGGAIIILIIVLVSAIGFYMLRREQEQRSSSGRYQKTTNVNANSDLEQPHHNHPHPIDENSNGHHFPNGGHSDSEAQESFDLHSELNTSGQRSKSLRNGKTDYERENKKGRSSRSTSLNPLLLKNQTSKGRKKNKSCNINSNSKNSTHQDFHNNVEDEANELDSNFVRISVPSSSSLTSMTTTTMTSPHSPSPCSMSLLSVPHSSSSHQHQQQVHLKSGSSSGSSRNNDNNKSQYKTTTIV